MSVYKRGDVWHFDFTVKGERHRGTTGLKKQADAKAYVERLRTDLILGKAPGRDVSSLGEAADRWFASRAKDRKSADTVAIRLRIMFRHLDRDMPVSQIGAREIEDALISRRMETIRGSRRVPTNATVNRDIIDTTLRPILNYARDNLEEQVRNISWVKLRLPEPKGRNRSFGDNEIKAWRAGLPAHHQPVFDFIKRYGPRLSEAFFHPDAVNLETQEIYLRDRKNGLDHTIPVMDDDWTSIVSRTTRAREAGLDTIWFSEGEGGLEPLHWRAFQSASRIALDKAGIEDAKPVHDLRHHAATTLLRETGNLKLVQGLLGHEDIVSSARYAHASKADLREGLRHTYGTKPSPKRIKRVESRARNET